MPNIDTNKMVWNEKYEWKDAGNEWSKAFKSADLQWYFFLYPRISYFLKKGNILEIAPGFGRWSKYLSTFANKYIGVDLAEKCINVCKEKFKSQKNMRFYLNNGKSLHMAKNDSLDLIFSFDSLVHADKDAMEPYIFEFAKKLKEGGYAFIHHSNLAMYTKDTNFNLNNIHTHWRSPEVDYSYIQELCKNNGLNCIQQELIPWSNRNIYLDCISIIKKDKNIKNYKTKVFELKDFSLIPQIASYFNDNYYFMT